MKEFDLVIIGGGPAGYVGAIRAAQFGLNVALIEKENLGGTCLNIGCIPTKTLLSYSGVIYTKKEGLNLSYNLDFDKIYNFKDAVINKLKQGIEGLLKSNKIDLIKGTASFNSKNSILVSGEEYFFKKAIVATGSKSFIPKSLFIDGYTVDSTFVLNNKNLGEKIVIVGGGVIGCELAFILNSFGKKVTIVEKMAQLLITEDKDSVKFVENSLKSKGIEVFLDNGVKSIEKGKVVLEKGEILESDYAVIAIGRIPNTDGLNLDLANINLGERKEIKIDKDFKTSNSNIYAVGDVAGGIQLAHYASATACKVVASIAGKDYSQNTYVVPRITYSIPMIASVGDSEKMAKEKGLNYKVGRFSYSASGKAMAMNETEGMVKVLVSDDKIIGAAVVGADADNLITSFTIAIALGISINDMVKVLYPHPTLSEIILEACEDTHGMAIHKPGRRR